MPEPKKSTPPRPITFIPARDLVGLAIGDVQVATDVLDTEVILENGQLAQDVTFETRQNRLWSLQP